MTSIQRAAIMLAIIACSLVVLHVNYRATKDRDAAIQRLSAQVDELSSALQRK